MAHKTLIVHMMAKKSILRTKSKIGIKNRLSKRSQINRDGWKSSYEKSNKSFLRKSRLIKSRFRIIIFIQIFTIFFFPNFRAF